MPLDPPHVPPRRIREATPADAPAIAALLAQVNDLHVALRPDLFYAAHRDAVAIRIGAADDGEAWLVAEDDGGVVGLAGIRVMPATNSPVFKPLPKAFLLNLVVDAERRGRGIGSLLLQAVRAWAIERSLDRVEVNVFACNAEAVRFYEKEGFSIQSHRLELPCEQRQE